MEKNEEAVDLFAGKELVVALEEGLAGTEVDRRLSVALRGGEVCNRALAFYLREVETRRLHQDFGCSSAVQYARERLGMSKTRASELLATARRLAILPQLDQAFAEGALPWSKVRLVARAATPDTESEWVACGRRVESRDLADLVAQSKEGQPPPDPNQGLPKPRFRVHVTVNEQQHQMLELAREKLELELGRQVGQAELLEELARIFLSTDSDGTIPGRTPVDGSLFRIPVSPENAESDAATAAAMSDAAVPRALRRRVLLRDQSACRACGGRRGLMLHHVIWHSRGGPTRAGNLVTLCARCHGLVHAGLLHVDGKPGTWRFRDRRGRTLSGVEAIAGLARSMAGSVRLRWAEAPAPRDAPSATEQPGNSTARHSAPAPA